MSLTRVSASKLTPNEMITLIFAKDVEIIRLTEERDEARREVCNSKANHLPTMADPRREAAQRGWDCFENKETQ